MKNWYSITAKADAPAEVHVFGPIGNTWDGEGVTARKFIEDFQAIDSDEVSLMVNSPGGSLFDGITIYSAMAASGKKITAKVMGVAASAASLIVMAADKITMPKNTHMMVHKAGWFAEGNADEMRAQAAVLDSMDASIISTYAARTGKPDEDIKQLLEQGDVWMSADEAKEAGFCDEVTPLVAITNLYDTATLPEAVRALLQPPTPAPVPVPAAPAATLVDQIEAICKAAGLEAHTAVFVLDDKLDTLGAAQAAVAQAQAVQAFCRVAGKPEQADAFISARKPVSEVRKALLDARAAEDEAAHISNTPPAKPTKPAASSGGGPVAMWAKRTT